MKKNLVVIDTNVLVSSFISNAGYPKKIFENLIVTGKIKICISNPVFDEYMEVLKRKKFQKYPGFSHAVSMFLKEIAFNSLWFKPKSHIDILKDDSDNKFLELAVEADAEYIVTGNTKDFTINNYNGIIICSPKDFYDHWFTL